MSLPSLCISPPMQPGLPCLQTPSTPTTLESPWFKRAAQNRTVSSPSMATKSSPQALYMDN
eukprot:11295127-Prorocentrum_lima.AAC.1